MTEFPTSKENLAITLMFESLGESRFNRTMAEYNAIAARAPKLQAMHIDVNRRLQEMAAAGDAPYQICYFKAGYTIISYEPFPTSLSLETIRRALVKSGMRDLQREHKRRKQAARRTH